MDRRRWWRPEEAERRRSSFGRSVGTFIIWATGLAVVVVAFCTCRRAPFHLSWLV